MVIKGDTWWDMGVNLQDSILERGYFGGNIKGIQEARSRLEDWHQSKHWKTGKRMSGEGWRKMSLKSICCISPFPCGSQTWLIAHHPRGQYQPEFRGTPDPDLIGAWVWSKDPQPPWCSQANLWGNPKRSWDLKMLRPPLVPLSSKGGFGILGVSAEDGQSSSPSLPPGHWPGIIHPWEAQAGSERLQAGLCQEARGGGSCNSLTL